VGGAFAAAIDRQKAQLVLVAGVAFSLLLFTLVRSLTLTRERAQLLADDMTAALRASETSARAAERQLRAVMNASPAGVVFTDIGGHIVYANPSYLRISGLDDARTGGLRSVHPDDHARVRDEWLAATRGAAPFESRFRFRHADGGIVWALARSAPMAEAGTVLGYVAIVEDISEQVAADAALAARSDALQRSNRELEQFAYVASHDLQEPLRTVSSYSTLLLRRHRARLGGDAQEFLDFIGDGAKRAQALIADLLALARVESRARPFAAVPLQQCLEQARRALHAALADAHAELTHDALPVLHGNAAQLTQVLQNLIGNAVKFRAAAAPRVHVGAAREAEGWRISVADNGIGIEPRFHERIFTLFQRLHGRDEYPGTGIGLAICKKVVERHGGRIGVASQPGRGATFFFTIPDHEVAPFTLGGAAAAAHGR
jgi:chemotaxis family two-component system sensor kinase Cph1